MAINNYAVPTEYQGAGRKEVISSDISSNIEGSKVTGKVTNTYMIPFLMALKSNTNSFNIFLSTIIFPLILL